MPRVLNCLPKPATSQVIVKFCIFQLSFTVVSRFALLYDEDILVSRKDEGISGPEAALREVMEAGTGRGICERCGARLRY